MSSTVTAMDVEAGKKPDAKKGPNCGAIVAFVMLGLVIVAGAVVGIVVANQKKDKESEPDTMPGKSGVMGMQGNWHSNYGGYHTVTRKHWYSLSEWGITVSEIASFGDGWVVMQNPADDAYNPSLWTKVEFHAHGSGMAFCMSVFDAASADDAYFADTSEIYDATDAVAGCGADGFSHTELTAFAMPLAGTYLSNHDGYHTISNDKWYSSSSWGASVTTLSAYTDALAISQNAADDAYNPSLWTKTEFHALAEDEPWSWGFCTSVYDGASAKAAFSADTSSIYNATDAVAGCGEGGFGHTKLTPFAFPLLGSWTSDPAYDTAYTITATTWTSVSPYGTSVYSIVAYGADFVLMQNAADDAYNPSLWTKVQFHAGATAGTYGYCMSVYDGATDAAALTADTSAIYDGTDVSAGCNGFGHTVITPAVA